MGKTCQLWKRICNCFCITMLTLCSSQVSGSAILHAFKSCTLHFFDMKEFPKIRHQSTLSQSDFTISVNLYTKTKTSARSEQKQMYDNYIYLFTSIKFHKVCVIHVLSKTKDYIKLYPDYHYHRLQPLYKTYCHCSRLCCSFGSYKNIFSNKISFAPNHGYVTKMEVGA